MYRRIRGRVGAVAVLAALSFATVAFAGSNREDWNCPGTPAQWCTNGGLHSYGSATAINSADSYNKCAQLVDTAVLGTLAIQCAWLTEVRTQTDDGSRPQLCPYPNNATSGTCLHLQAQVLNNVGVSHGLRGVSFY
jgi:hypothetical protein